MSWIGWCLTLTTRWLHSPPWYLQSSGYPVDPNKWTMDRGDTGAILGSGMGVILGFHLHGRFPDDFDSGPFVIAMPSLQVIGASVVRFVVGVLLLLPTRFVMKLLCFRLLPAIMPTHGVKEVVKRPLVELPYKIITYSMIALNTTYLVFYVFEICNISRFWVLITSCVQAPPPWDFLNQDPVLSG